MKARLLPDCMPKGWHAGFVHYHTAFGYKKPHAVSPEAITWSLRR